MPDRIYERDTDALFIRSFKQNPPFRRLVLEQTSPGQNPSGDPLVRGQVRHRRDPGSIDIEIHYSGGLLLLIENKIDAGYSITFSGAGQPDRYARSAEALRTQGIDARSVLLAPGTYLAASRTASKFDVQISYESLRPAFSDDDLCLLDKAIDQASAPYEPIANARTMSFFSGYACFVAERFPSLVLKGNPNADGVRPDHSRTIYFDVSRTLTRHSDIPRARMSLQCWDASAPAASMKIMIGDWGKHAALLSAPESLIDIGGYLRPAGRSLGIVIDTPRLNTQIPFEKQLGEIVEGLEAAIRLKYWWENNAEVLSEWSTVIERSKNAESP